MEQTLQIILNAKDATANAFNSAKGGLDNFQSKVEDMQPAFRKMATAGTVAFGAISAIAVKGIADFAAAERSQRQLEHAILDVSKGTKDQVAQVNALSTAIEKKTGMDADSINAGVAQLSTFGLQSTSVVNLTKSLADLTVNQSGVNAGAEDYIGSANMIAKALNGQFGILEKSGIRFTELQKNMILTGTETQKVAALQEGFAQNLRETTDTVGGADVAMAKFKTQLGNVSEGIGKALMPALNSIMEKLLPIIEKFSAWAEKNPDLLAKIILVAGAIAGLVAVMGFLGMVFGPIAAGFGLVSTAVVAFSGFIMSTAIPAVISFVVAFAPIIGIIALIALLAFGVYELIKHWTQVKQFFIELWDSVKGIFFAHINLITGTIKAFLEAIVLIWTTVWNGIKDFFVNIWDSIVDTAKTAIQSIKNFLQPIISMIDNVISRLQSIGKSVGNSVKGAVGAVGGFLGINDGIVQNGQIITTHPDDYIVATKDPASLGRGRGGIVVNINGGNYLSRDAALMMGDEIIKALQLQMRGA